MATGNYVSGVTSGAINSGTATYNLLISGAGSGNDYATSGIYLGNDITKKKGAQLSFSNDTGNTFLDFNGTSTNSMNFRYTENGVVFRNMLGLMTEDLTDPNRTVATFGGRVQASQYMVNATTNEMRVNPNAPATYMAQNATAAYFIMNANGRTGNQGFTFATTHANGVINRTNLNLIQNGMVNTPYYVKTLNSDDTENISVAGLDENGNLIRSYATNKRIRAAEASIETLTSSLSSGLQTKVNEVINRLNGLNFFSNNIEIYQVPTKVHVTSATGGSGNITVTYLAISGFDPAQSGYIQYSAYATNSTAKTATFVADGYNAASSNGGLTIVLTSLVQGDYTVYVTATNTSGTSIASNGSAATVNA